MRVFPPLEISDLQAISKASSGRKFGTWSTNCENFQSGGSKLQKKFRVGYQFVTKTRFLRKKLMMKFLSCPAFEGQGGISDADGVKRH